MTSRTGPLDPTGDMRAAFLAALEYDVSPINPRPRPTTRENTHNEETP